MYNEYTVTETCRAEITVEKSRFIAYIYPLADVANASDILKRLKKEYYDSTHVCYAYITENALKFSDDGEPQDTAGKPILEVLKAGRFKNVLIAVVRYFGGVKLGTGGLARAYTESAASAVRNAAVYPVVPVIYYGAKMSYKIYPALKKVLSAEYCTVIREDYGEDVTAEFAVTLEEQERVLAEISEATLGAVGITELSRGKMVIK